MLEAILITYLVSIAVGIFAFFTWWCMGSPVGAVGAPGAGHVDMGRIFSWLGVIVLKRFDALEAKENKRIADMYRTACNAQKVDKMGEDSKAEALHEIRTITENTRKANIYKIFGACLPCFATWFAVPCLMLCAASGVLPVSVFACFTPFMVPIFAALTNKLF